MQKLALAVSILAISSVSALAADMAPRYTKAPAMVASPAYSWTGFYAGVNAGYGVAADPSTLDAFTNPVIGFDNLESYKISPAGVLGGVQVGANWQTGLWVFGLETDFQGTSQKDSVCVLICSTDGTVSATVSQKLPWFGTVRGRVGVAVDRSLLYVTGGLAYGRVETSVTEVDGPTTAASISETKTGWTVGGGIEAALTGNWTAKVEYLYVDLGSQTLSFVDAAGPPGAITATAAMRDHIFRAGVNYRLGGPVGLGSSMPVKAPYLVPPTAWTGFYAGLNVGYGIGRDPTTYAASFIFGGAQAETFKIAPANVLGGGQVGYNWQFGKLVAGLESDIQATGMRDSACVFGCINNTFFNLFGIVEHKLPWFGTVRGRLGFVGDGGALFYLTGGLAYGEEQTNIRHIQGSFFPSVTVSATQTKAGWTAGGGVEVPLGAGWRGKAEYLYVDLGSQTVAFTPNPFTNVAVTSAFRENIFRIGANYAFNWGGPLVTKY
jgi:outer membrane immunogenic protein